MSVDGVIVSIVLSGLTTILFFLIIGTFRILLVNLRWKKWHIILCKFNLLIAEIAVFISFGDLVIFKILMPETMKEFAFAFVFGMFATNFEIFARISALDGTDSLKYEYEVVSDEELDERVHEGTS